MKLLFATLQHIETDFYRRVGAELRERGHEVFHLVYSRRGAAIAKRGSDGSWCLPDLLSEATPEGSWEDEERRILEQYPISSLRDVYKTDPPFRGLRPRLSEAELVERTLRHFLAVERLYDELGPDFVIPEVGSETMRTVCHLVGVDRGITTLFLMYTLFDDPLRLYADTMHAPIVEQSEVRELSAAENEELDGFIHRFTERAKPIRDYRRVSVSTKRLRIIARHFAVKALWDRDNEYLTPIGWLIRDLREKVRARVLRFLYSERDPSRKFVYFPLHVTDDYKILRLIPHCVHQEAIIMQVAAALPHGYDVIIKEHPMSIGRNEVSMLRRLAKVPNIRLVPPHTSSHQLVQDAEAIAVISSTVGIEALMYDKPVLTLGQPFYSGYGVTVDVDSFREIPEKVPELLEFSPDPERIRRFLHAAMRHCYPGAPVLVDRSDENARRLADTLDRAVRGGLVPDRTEADQPASNGAGLRAKTANVVK
jgi:hypothetical protein